MVENYQDIQGWFDFEQIYQNAVKKAVDGEILIEIGTWLGKSTAFMAQLIKDSGKELDFYSVDHHFGSKDKGHIETLENLNGSTFTAFIKNIKMCGLTEYVTPIACDSEIASKHFRNKTISFIFIDGGHSCEQIKKDIKSWLPKLKDGGTIAGHDIEWDSVQKAVVELLPCYQRFNSCWIVD